MGAAIIKLSHVNIVARNAEKLAAFYTAVFCCVPKREPVVLHGEKVSQGNGLQGVSILSIWLTLAGSDEPFLEIHQYSKSAASSVPEVNAPGLGHLAFKTDKLQDLLQSVIAHGGAIIGQTDLGSREQPCQIAYVRDPEGNILELEQSPK